ncbi:hypothetical protein SAMN04515674_102395 [Pseudarcicella hirudinis]|uniref:FAR-17a/AIG1-like protein n=1 Tax=Pseudarcicella hirudinis TaxID=1079859 RepID=A0A1I5PBR5_9BACT|nr:Pr6Pr family membrane protein [Pseudarcicella hirudinis]SFP31542.1 hypothetical protein SAMN04515674_102395 [Pseudarcicella hirudinis]
MSNNQIRTLSVIGTLLGWFAVLLQLYLIIVNRKLSVPLTLINFFSYFTILTNILVSVCFTFISISPDSKCGKFFSKARTLTAIAVYITVVGAVYNLVLRQLWHPEGLQKLADELLHSVNPVFFIIFWIITVPKKSLSWGDTPEWLIYPLIYCIYILIRGAISGLYPYPFIDVNTLGYGAVVLNCCILFLVFLGISLGFVALGKYVFKAD